MKTTILRRLQSEQGNESMQTVLIMAAGAMVMIGVNNLFRQVSPRIQSYIQQVISGKHSDNAFDGGRFVFDNGQRGFSAALPSRPTETADHNDGIIGDQGDSDRGQDNVAISAQELFRQAAGMSYSGKPGDQTSDGQWQIDENGVIEDHTGFRAIILVPADGSNSGAIVAFAGTKLGINDIANDIEQGISGYSPQYIRAVRLAETLKEQYEGNIYVTGHSLGGGLASLASVVNDVPGSAFNAAPLGGFAAIESARIENEKPSGFLNINNEYDPVSHLLPGRQVGQSIEIRGDHGWLGFGISDHLIGNMVVEKK